MPRRKRRLASRIRNYLRNLLAFLFSNVGVVVLVVAYIIAGAFMFQAIEGASEIERAQNMTLEREKAARCLWEFALELNVFNESALKDRITIKMQDYQRKIVLAVRRGWNGGRSSPQWSFSSAFLYSLTVITAIGYGHISPRTSWGKVATILYTLLGMPLFLLYLANVGELLARWFKCIYALVCLCRGCPGFTRRRVVRLRAQMELSDVESIECPEHWRRAPRWSDVESDSADGPTPLRLQRREHPRSASVPPPARAPPLRRRWSDPPSESVLSDFSYVTFDAQSITVPISVCVAILVGYIMFGSMIFGMWENWDQLDGAYFCFISLSRYGGWWTGVMFGKPSIGFGDFVPGERVYTEKIETSFIVCSVYLMLGMALVAMCFNLMQEQVRHYFAGLKRALKRICRCKR